jgi:DNA-binding SARP family transcriptional activator
MNGNANSNSSSSSKITYHQQVSYCGKPRCRKCREGKGHGPYWYAYQTINGHTTRTYIGKNLPPGVQPMQESVPVNRAERVPPSTLPNLVADLSTARIRLFVLGQMRLERRQQRQWQSVTDMAWQLQDVRALLGLLLCDPQRRVRREQVINALWPESDNDTAYESLNRVVESLRQILELKRELKREPTRGRAAPSVVGKSTRPRSTQAGVPLLSSEGEWLVLAGQSQIWVDADAFEAMLTRVWDLDEVDEEDEGQALLHRERMLHEAEALYGGDFLPEERRGGWALERRQMLRRDYSTLLLELADISIIRGATASALEILDRLLAADAANEAAVQRFIYVFAQQKRRGEALRAYRRLEDVLQREYQIHPSDETRELYEAVLQGRMLPERLVRRGRASTTQERQASEETAVLPTQRGQVPGDLASWQIGRVHQSPLVGREMELESLRTMFQDVEQDTKLQLAQQRRVSGIPLDTQRRPQCMVLLGEAGIGKTRLAEEVSRDALRRGWWVVWSRIYPQERGIPYHIWIEVLRRALTGSGVRNALRTPYPVGAGGGSTSSYLNATQETIQQLWQQADGGQTGEQRTTERWGERGRKKREAGEVEAGLPLQWQPLVALLPELASQFPTPMVPMMTPEQEQLRLWEAIRDLLVSASESAPLLIVLDDIQWTDGSSGELLGYLARHIYGHPVVLLATCRDTELPTQPPHPLRTLVAHMQREHTVKTLPINPLSSEEIRRLVSHLPESVVQYIQEQAAGNPFFAEELARSTPYEIPSSVAAALQHRMSRLSQSCQQLLGNAAVLGGSFEFPLIAAMETDNAMSDEDTVLDLLEEALQSGVLTEEGAGTRVTYHFWHPLLVNHLYDNVSALRRSRLHVRAANILQRIHKGREDEVAATITHHLVKGGAEPAQIAHFGELAGDRAYTFSAYSEAEYHYRLTLEQRGLTIGTSSSAIASAAERAVAADPHILHLLELLAECMMIRGKFADVRHLYTAILEVRGAHYASSAYEIQKQALLWGEIAWTWRYMGDNARARECCQRGEQVLHDAGIKEGPALARLRQQLGSIYWQEGRYQEARGAAEEALALFARLPKAPMTPPAAMQVLRTTRIQRTLEGDPVDPGSAHRLLGALAEAEGHLSEALEHLNTALVIFEQADHPRRIAHVSHDIGYVHIKKAEYEQAQAALRRAYSLAERIGDNPLIGVITSNRAELAALTGELEEAEKLYRESLAYAERMQDREYISWWNARLAYVLKDLNKVEEATACIIRALSTARAMQNQPRIGTALLALANLRIAQAQPVRKFPNVRKRLLLHAQQDVERALALSSLEAETNLKCRLALAQISFLLGKEGVRTEIEQVIEEARSCELAQVETLAQRLLQQPG